MKKYLPLIFLFATSLAAEPLVRPAFEFDRDKLAQATDAFAFYRATADYFYLLSARNQDRLAAVHSFVNVTGWCAGDAHPDNFGALVTDGAMPIFALNDMDDAGPCPLIMDLERFLLGATFAGGKVEDLLPAFLAGTRGETWPTPHPIRKLLKKSAERGTAPDPDDLADETHLARRKRAREMTEEERGRVSAAVGETPIDAYATAKIGGGSHGLLRYELLFQHPKRVLELKTLVAPAVASVGHPPAPRERMARTLELERDGRASPLYGVVELDGTPMLQRPRYHGDIGIKIFDLEREERADVLAYEAFRLGQLHAHSKSDWAARLDPQILAADVAALREHFEKLFREF